MCAAYLPRNVLTGHLILYRDTGLINIGFHSWELEQNILSSSVRGTGPFLKEQGTEGEHFWNEFYRCKPI